MKIFLRTSLALFILAFFLMASQCNRNNPKPSITQYSYVDSIVNPPDSFQIIFNISTLGDKFAHVTFDKDAVWLIEKLGDGRINFSIENGTDTRVILKSDTLGLKGGFYYTFVANNNNYLEFNNFFSQLTKLNLNYTTFEPKF